jgi:methylenetetrahydrofolate dehydrogenase (NADP+)/methenyltetrahydrofolate cyclohydrolase
MAKVIRLNEFAERIHNYTEEHMRDFAYDMEVSELPCLAILQVAGDMASEVYLRKKKEAVLSLGGTVRHFIFTKDTLPQAVRRVINDLNNDPHVHGIILQLPVPWDEVERAKTLSAIRPDKDVDGLGRAALTALAEGEYRKFFVPCTPKAVEQAILELTESIEGKHVLVIGRSRLVGLPLALLMQHKWNCTVSIAHSYTDEIDLNLLSAAADVIVVATGTPKRIRLPDAMGKTLIIDVGVNKDSEGVLCGDVDHTSLNDEVRITASPGGIGLLTVESLCQNLVTAWKNQWLKDHPEPVTLSC